MSDPLQPPSSIRKALDAIDAYVNVIAALGTVGLIGGFLIWLFSALPILGISLMMFSLGALCVCMIGHLSVSHNEPLLSLGSLASDVDQKLPENKSAIDDQTRAQAFESMPPSGRELFQLVAPDERIVANVTVAYLMEQFDGRTTAEAHRIVGPYIGKWLQVGAAINDVKEQGRETQITLSPKIDSRKTLITPGHVFVWGASQQWKDRASILKPGDIVHVEGQILRIDSHAVTLVQAEFIQSEDRYGDNPARLTVSFNEHYDRKVIHPITHHRFRVHNPFLPVAKNVQARLIDMQPRPKAPIFASDFPYRLKTVDGDTHQDINHATLQFFELCTSWVSAGGELMVGGLDTRNDHPVKIPVEADEVWHLQIEVSCANAPVENIFFRVTPGGKTLRVVQIDGWPESVQLSETESVRDKEGRNVAQPKTEGLVASYNGGRYDHKERIGEQIVYRIIRLQLENKSGHTVSGIKVKAESFNNLDTAVPQVPLRICHDEHGNKKDGFSLAPGEKELIDVVDKGIGWPIVRLCSPLSFQMVTRETGFQITVVITAEGQPKRQKRLRIAVDEVEVLHCDPLRA